MKLKMLALLALVALPLAAQAHEEMAVSSTAKTKTKSAIVHKTKKVKTLKADKVAAAKKEHWVCPMHDGGESDHAGHCKKCGMDLVKEEK